MTLLPSSVTLARVRPPPSGPVRALPHHVTSRLEGGHARHRHVVGSCNIQTTACTDVSARTERVVKKSSKSLLGTPGRLFRLGVWARLIGRTHAVMVLL